jgi:voltage-gated potassium channel Kch
MKKIPDGLSLQDARIIRNRFRILAGVTLVLLALGVFMMHYLEGMAYLDALYFSVVSLTTVGYGDFTPQTTGGKIFVMLYLIVGIGVIAAFITNLVKSVLAKRVIDHYHNLNHEKK